MPGIWLAQFFGSAIGNLILDATTSEVHRKTSRLTDHPVEEGADVTDHIQQQPEEIDIVGLVSNDPVWWAGIAPSPIATDYGSPLSPLRRRADVAYAELDRIMEAGELLTVLTSMRSYENMAITAFTVPKDVGTGNVLPVSMTLRELIKVETKEVAAPVTVKKADAAPVDVGKQTPKEIPPEEAGPPTSILHGGYQALRR